MTADHDHFMGIAIDESGKAAAEGNSPVGSIIVRNVEVIGIGQNRVTSENDPTAHAEVDAIRDACRKLGTTNLSDAYCYTSMEPCPMCCWAIKAAGLAGMVIGARHADMKDINPLAKQYANYTVEALDQLTDAGLDIITDIRHQECVDMRRSWIAENAPK